MRDIEPSNGSARGLEFSHHPIAFHHVLYMHCCADSAVTSMSAFVDHLRARGAGVVITRDDPEVVFMDQDPEVQAPAQEPQKGNGKTFSVFK